MAALIAAGGGRRSTTAESAWSVRRRRARAMYPRGYIEPTM